MTVTTESLHVMGLATQYPSRLIRAEELEFYVRRWYNTDNAAIKKLLAINRNTGIETRTVVRSYNDPFWDKASSPSISDIDEIFRIDGVHLATEACKKALQNWNGQIEDISHTVAVTCTNTANPGFDLAVAQNLGLRQDIERTLIHGVGCAGGLAAMRVAANIALGATQRNKPANILVFACELCSLHLRCDLDAMIEDETKFSIASTLFSDGAAAFIMSTDLGSNRMTGPNYTVLGWKTAVLPDTHRHMSFLPCPSGFRLTLAKDVPDLTSQAIAPMFRNLLSSIPTQELKFSNSMTREAEHFDWAVHPGGLAILRGAQRALSLTEDDLRASYDIYRTRGNSSSASVLIVLDQLQHYQGHRKNIVVCAFGPGLTIEMALLQRPE